ncbi:MAG TPA: thioredoxin [Candidatus Humimicrobiaceae bacterium]|nr:thioredoxin [Candidatus Humimicrobiaceae bacterium]
MKKTMIEINLTDQNFDQFIQSTEKPVLVDFWAQWCTPCLVLGPTLEKIAREYSEKLTLVKVNLDTAPQVSQKYGIERIPTVILFKDEKPVSGFIGLRPEPIIKEFLDEALEKKLPAEIPDNIEEIIKNYQTYAEKNGLKLNPDREAVERLVKGLLANEKKHGARYCPCRRVSGNPEEDKPKICPCQWHKEEIVRDGHCLCGLFVKNS